MRLVEFQGTSEAIIFYNNTSMDYFVSQFLAYGSCELACNQYNLLFSTQFGILKLDSLLSTIYILLNNPRYIATCIIMQVVPCFIYTNTILYNYDETFEGENFQFLRFLISHECFTPNSLQD